MSKYYMGQFSLLSMFGTSKYYQSNFKNVSLQKIHFETAHETLWRYQYPEDLGRTLLDPTVPVSQSNIFLAGFKLHSAAV